MKTQAIHYQSETNPWVVAFIVSIVAFMEVLDTTITNVSLSHIAGSLGATSEESTWVLTSYLVSNGIILPISGWLANVIGRKQYFMLCIIGFTGASLACGMAESLPMLVLFRLIQGLAGGGLQPTQQAIILDAFPPDKRASAFAVTGITMVFAPIIGPTLGGLITDNLSWRWIFYINVPVGIITLSLVNRVVHNQPHTIARGFKNIDYIGLSLISLGLGSLQIVLDRGQMDDWLSSKFIIFFMSVSAASIITAVLWILKREEDPIVDLRLLKDPGFGLSFVFIFITGFFLYSSAVMLPLLLQSQFGYDATLAGLVLSPGGIAAIILMPVSAKLLSKLQAKYIVITGFLLCCFGMFNSSFITQDTNYGTFVFIRVTQVLGIPFLFIPLSIIAFKNIHKEQNNKASALYSMARNLGGSTGIALMTTLISRREQVWQAYLNDNTSAYSRVFQDRIAEMSRIFVSQGGNPVDAETQAMSKIYQEMLDQATFLAYHDAFLALMVIAGIFAAFSFLLPKNNPKANSNVSTPH
jgi:DHA2 family multidrug resistance protein